MKKFLLLCTIFTSCYEKSGNHNVNAVITNHDIRVAAKRFIRKDLKEPAKAKFAPDNEIKIVRMKPDNTFTISIYEEEQNGSGEIVRKNYNLQLQYTGGKVDDIKSWKVLKKSINT